MTEEKAVFVFREQACLTEIERLLSRLRDSEQTQEATPTLLLEELDRHGTELVATVTFAQSSRSVTNMKIERKKERERKRERKREREKEKEREREKEKGENIFKQTKLLFFSRVKHCFSFFFSGTL